MLAKGKTKLKLEDILIDLGWSLVQLHGIGGKQYSGAWLDKKLDDLIYIAKKLNTPSAISVLDSFKEHPKLKHKRPKRYCVLDCIYWEQCKVPDHNLFGVVSPPKTKKEYQALKRSKAICREYTSKNFSLSIKN